MHHAPTTPSPTDPTPSTTIDTAQEYARRGWPVLRIAPRAKHPAEPRGFKDATTDPAEIERRWTQQPTAGVGVATGAPIPGHGFLYVVDVDPPKDGDASFDALVDELGPLPTTFAVNTGGGGQHYYLTTETPLRNRTAVMPGIDGRGAGGYVVAPPSFHPSGDRYTVRCDAPIASLPAPWLSRFANPTAPEHRCRDGHDGHDGAFVMPATVLDGSRNDTLFRYACSERARGTTDDKLRELVATANAATCTPPLNGREIERIVQQAQRYPTGVTGPAGVDAKKAPLAEMIAALATAHDLFHDPDNRPFATVPVGTVRHILAVDSSEYRAILEREFFERHRKVASDHAMKAAIGVIRARAMFDGDQRDVHLRVSGDTSYIKLDLTDAPRRAVRITSTGFDIVESADPPPFRRASGARPLPEPRHGGDINRLRDVLNLEDDRSFHLVAGFLLACLHPTGPYPILAVHGPQGSGKSTASSIIRRMLDPVQVPLRPLPSGGEPERNLFVAAHSNWILGWDNISVISDTMSDALCRMATGGGFAARKHYSNDDEHVIEATRPQILNGIVECATRPDLLDRMLLLRLPRITPENRATATDLERRVQQAHPEILGALCDAASTALANLSITKLDAPSRLADAETWVTAGESSFGWPPGTFSNALRSSRKELIEVALESSPFAQFLLHHIPPGGSWTGTAGDLRDAWIKSGIGDKIPGSPRGVAAILQRMEPALAEAGIEVDRPPRSSNSRAMAITRTAETTVMTVTPSSTAQSAVENAFGPVTVIPTPEVDQ